MAATPPVPRNSLRAFVDIAVRDLEQAVACLEVENAAQSPSLLRAATRLTDMAADRIAIAEKALREWGPHAPVNALELPASGSPRRSTS
jgi:hypothetical protein